MHFKEFHKGEALKEHDFKKCSFDFIHVSRILIISYALRGNFSSWKNEFYMQYTFASIYGKMFYNLESILFYISI